MCVRWLATVRSPRNSAAATSRFVRPSATSAATRRSAAVSPSSRVRPPMRPELAARPLDPGRRSELLERRRAPLRSPRGPRASAVRASGRRRARAARGPGRTGRRRPRAARPPARGATAAPSTSPSGGGDEPAAARHLREHPASGRAASRPPPRRRGPAPRRRSGRARAAPPRSRRVHERRLGSPQPSSAACRSASPSQLRGRRRSPLQSATSPRTARCMRRVEAELLLASSSARSECARASSSWPRWTATHAIGRWSCGISSPYWTRMSCARAAWSAASSQRPAQNSTHESSQSARALRGSSRSRHSRYSRSSSARAASLSTRREERPRHRDCVASCTSSRVADGGREARAHAPRTPGASASPDDRGRERRASTSALDAKRVVVEVVGELERRARMLERRSETVPEARRPREPAVDRPTGAPARDAASRRASSSSAAATIDALELGEEDERLGARRADLRLGQQVGRDRAGARPLARGLVRTSRGQRPAMTLVASRPAASAGAPARRARPRRPTRHDRLPSAAASSSTAATSASGCVRRQREVTRAEERVVDDLGEPSRGRRAAPSPSSW